MNSNAGGGSNKAVDNSGSILGAKGCITAKRTFDWQSYTPKSKLQVHHSKSKLVVIINLKN